MKIKNIILDRDGVINHDSDNYIKSPTEFIIIDKVIDALFLLQQKKINVFVATNQSGIGRGLYTLQDFLNINRKLLDALEGHYKNHTDNKILNLNNIITAVYYCPHTPTDNCYCRKPEPGMIKKIQANHGINLEQTAFIGDTMRDLQAAETAGCKFKFLVKTGKGQDTYNKHKDKLESKYVFDNLFNCVEHIVKNYL